jgi:hypothetical protein
MLYLPARLWIDLPRETDYWKSAEFVLGCGDRPCFYTFDDFLQSRGRLPIDGVVKAFPVLQAGESRVHHFTYGMEPPASPRILRVPPPARTRIVKTWFSVKMVYVDPAVHDPADLVAQEDPMFDHPDKTFTDMLYLTVPSQAGAHPNLFHHVR